MQSKFTYVAPTEPVNGGQYNSMSLEEMLGLLSRVRREIIYRLAPSSNPDGVDEQDLKVIDQNWDQLSTEGSHFYTAVARCIDKVDGNEGKIDSFVSYNDDKDLAYAQFFFMLKRMPAIMQMSMSEQIKPYELYCDWKGTRYRVTGASRFGDVWLQPDFTRAHGYEERVMMSECSNWAPQP